jgi:hypothetical protein
MNRSAGINPSVFVPASFEFARRLRRAGTLGPVPAFTASDGLAADLGAALSEEEIDYAALNLAGVALLVEPHASDPRRLVLAAEVGNEQLTDLDVADVGSAKVSALHWKQVIALFVDDVGAEPAVTAARVAVRGKALREAQSVTQVADLLDQHDLLWYDPAELDQAG